MKSRNHELRDYPVGDLEGYINKFGVDNRAFASKVQDMRSSWSEKVKEEIQKIMYKVKAEPESYIDKGHLFLNNLHFLSHRSTSSGRRGCP